MKDCRRSDVKEILALADPLVSIIRSRGVCVGVREKCWALWKLFCLLLHYQSYTDEYHGPGIFLMNQCVLFFNLFIFFLVFEARRWEL
jgi:hypothetical protein